jgi:exonuclease SbcC
VLAKKQADITKVIEQRAVDKDNSLATLNSGLQALAIEQQKLSTLSDRLASADRELGPWIEPAGINPADLDSDMPAALAQLRSRSQDWSIASSHVAELGARLGNMATELVQARANAEAGASALAQAGQDFALRVQQHADKKAERATLLDGEATEVHRSRINAARIAEQEASAQKAAESSSAASEVAAAQEALTTAVRHMDACQTAHEAAEIALEGALAGSELDREALASVLGSDPCAVTELRVCIGNADHAVLQAEAALTERLKDLEAALAAGRPETPQSQLESERTMLDERQAEHQSRNGAIRSQLGGDDAVRAAVAKIDHDLAAATNVASVWKAVNAAVGSRNGDRFQRFAQGVTLDLLVELANNHLRVLKPRYRIRRAVGQELGLHVVDLDMGEEVRSTRSLSGGERFLVSLALALALSGLEGRQSFVDTLFIDEGFASLDAESLDIAIDALETLQGHGRTVGVISHVDTMKERIPVQVRVTRQGSGRSTVSISAPEDWAA